MKTLYITSKPVYPKVDGGCVASANFLNNLCEVVSSVKYLSIETDKHPFNLGSFPVELAKIVQPEAVYIQTAIRPMEAFKYLFNKKSFNIDRFYSDAFKKKIEETLSSESYDLIILDSLYTTPYLDSIRSVYSGKILVRTHNVEYKIWESLSENESNPVKKKYLNKLTKDLKNYEIESLNKVDGIITLSQDDLNDLNDLNVSVPKSMITISADVQDIDYDYSNANIFHLGAMNWQPNIEAVKYIIDLMPEIRIKNPKIEFHIAGVESESLFSNDPINGIVVDGYIENLSQYVSKMGILLSPILSGSGIRVKILEMMAFGIPVITTSIGAQGLLDTTGVYIANSKKEILEAVYELSNNENKRRHFGLEAKRYVNLYHNPDKVRKQLIEFIRSI